MATKIILYIATSKDGFIATKDGSVAWLDAYATLGEDYGYQEFIKNIDTVVMGNTTYEQVLGFGYPYKDKEGYVFAHKKGKDAHVTFVHGDVKTFVDHLQGERTIFLIGGANIINQFLAGDLIDEFIICVMPEKLGKGIRLFSADNYEARLELIKRKTFPSGVIESHYKKK